jgi:hypothetical protein
MISVCGPSTEPAVEPNYADSTGEEPFQHEPAHAITTGNTEKNEVEPTDSDKSGKHKTTKLFHLLLYVAKVLRKIVV